MTHEQLETWERRVKVLMLLVTTAFGFYVLTRIPGCGSQKPQGQDPAPVVAAPTPKKECGDTKIGQTKATLCPDKKSNKIEACTEAGLVTAIECPSPPTGVECNKTTFAEVKPILTSKCVSCHQGYDSYETAKGKGKDYVARINLPASSPQRMPKAPNPELPANEKDLFKKWQLDGFLEKCGETQKPVQESSINFDQIEGAIIDKLNQLSEETRLNSRFLVMSHKVDQGSTSSDMELFFSATTKTANSLNKLSKRLTKPERFGPSNSIVRINLEDYELNRKDWDNIIAADPLKLESFTNKGKVIKFLTQNLRPWMHFDNFVDTTQRNSKLYHALLGTPATFAELVRYLGVNFAGDFLNFKAQLIGTNRSPLSLKNRLISRHDSVDGYFWVTYDTDGLKNNRQNLFEFPLLKETGSKQVFDFQAGEVIYSLPNGLQAYALFNNKGERQDVAPVNIVRDVESPISPEIRNASSCHRCHNGGIIPTVDEVRDHVLKNASEFKANDVEIVKVLYRDAAANVATFKGDNDAFVQALANIGIKPGVDPMNYATDRLLLNWDLNQTASFFFVTKEEFVQLLNQSAAGRAQVGNLLSGSSITYDQFVTILPQLIKDLRLFQEPLGK